MTETQTLTAETQRLLAQLVLGVERAMQRVAANALAAGATQAQADAAAWRAFRNHVAELQAAA